MKRRKKIIILTVVAFILAAVAIVGGMLMSLLPFYADIFNFEGIVGVYNLCVKTLPHYIFLAIKPEDGKLVNNTTLSFLGVVIFMVLLGILLMFRIGYKKNIKAHGVWFLVFWLLLGAVYSLFVLGLFTTNFLPSVDGVVYSKNKFGAIGYVLDLTLNDNAFLNVLFKIISFIPIALILASFIVLLVAYFRDFSLLGKKANEIAYLEACEAAEREGRLKPERPEGDDEEEPVLSQEEKKEEVASQESFPKVFGISDGKGGIQGPILVQYINTQTGEAKQAPYDPGHAAEKRPSDVPLDEVKAAITGQKSMSAEDVRKIIQEEFARERLENQAAIPNSDSAELRDLLKLQLEEPKPEPKPEADIKPSAIAASDPSNAEPKQEPVQTLSQEDIQAVIRDELLMFQQAQTEAEEARLAERENREQEELARRKAEEQKSEEEAKALKDREDDYRRQLEETARLKAEKEAVEEALRKLQSQEPEKVVAPAEPSLSADQIKRLIAEALAEQKQAEPAPVEAKEGLSGDEVRAIIRDELSGLLIPQQQPQPVVVTVNAPAPEEAKEEEPAPVEEPKKRVVGAINPDLPPHDKIIRISFPDRMVDADDLMKSNYNELKSELMAYGMKSRVSNSGDTFRLHKVTYVKIAIAGKSLKLYMALDPKDYADSSLPIGDVSAKNTYKDIPFVFKVKSPLSMRRAKQLIAELMDKHDLEQGKVNPHNWADELKDYKPTGAKEEDE